MVGGRSSASLRGRRSSEACGPRRLGPLGAKLHSGRSRSELIVADLRLFVKEAAADVRRRSRDWSQVRPEWGLAGNAAFIADDLALLEMTGHPATTGAIGDLEQSEVILVDGVDLDELPLYREKVKLERPSSSSSQAGKIIKEGQKKKKKRSIIRV